MLVVYIRLDKAHEAWFASRPPPLAPPVYRPRIEAMTSLAARARTTAGLWLLKQGLARLGYPAETFLRLGFGPGGRPGFAGGPFFSISHSVQLVACALAPEQPLGLDVEARRAGISPRLRHAIAPAGDFFAAWCAREAAAKASGHVGLARIRAVELDDALARLDGRAWHLIRPALAPGYAACVASAEPMAPGALAYRDCGGELSPVRAV